MITLTDIFAGAGGSSTGAAGVRGVRVAVSANHWPLAVNVHQLNHQQTIHYCVDLHMEDPRNFPKTDILWASPECTKWSIANSKAKELSVAMGGDPTLFNDVPDDLLSEGDDEISRSRLLMFDVLRFIEHARYRAVIVENVIDIATLPKYRAAWIAWQKGLRKLGYEYRVVSLNSMHAQMAGDPAPQSRDRLYIVAWPAGDKPIDVERALRPWAWCPRCRTAVESQQAWKPGRTVGRYKAQYVYACGHCGHEVTPGWLPAASAIDWTLPAERIGDRKRPLSDKTMARIRAGLRRYGGLPRFTATSTEVADAEAIGQLTLSEREGALLDDVMRTQTCRNETGLLVPSGGTWHEEAHPTSDPMRAVTTRENHGLLVPYYSGSNAAKPTTEPIGTLTTVDRYALVTLRGTNTPKPPTAPLDTVAAQGNHHGLMSITEDDVMACRFRMLEPSEIAVGMAFPRNYQWLGTKRERVRLAGNAVTPPAARDLVACVAESLGVDAA